MELTDLMPHPGEQFLDYHRIQRRAIGGDSQDLQTASLQLSLELAEERSDVLLRRVVFQNPIGQSRKRMIVQDATQG